jgi:hypothetical protein
MSAGATAHASLPPGAFANLVHAWPKDIDLPDGFLPPDELSAVKRHEGYEDVVDLGAGVFARWTAIFVFVNERLASSSDDAVYILPLSFLRSVLEQAKSRPKMLHIRCCVLERCGLLERLIDLMNTRSTAVLAMACITLADVLLGIRVASVDWGATPDIALLQFLVAAHNSFWRPSGRVGRGSAAMAGIIRSVRQDALRDSTRLDVICSLYHAATYTTFILSSPLDDSVVDAGLFNLVASCLLVDGYVTAAGPELTAKTIAFRLLRCWQPMTGDGDLHSLAKHFDNLASLGILNAAARELSAWRAENFTAENSDQLQAALILTTLFPIVNLPALVNAAVADTFKVINACARLQVQAEHVKLAGRLAFQALWFLFDVANYPTGHDAALVAYYAGALSPAFRAAAKLCGTNGAREIIKHMEAVQQRAVDAADAAMAELLAEEESAAAAKASKSKSKAKKRKTGAASAGGASGAAGGASGDAADLQPPPPAPVPVPPPAAAPPAARAPAPPLPAAVARSPAPAEAAPPAVAPRAAPAPAPPAAIVHPAPAAAPPPLPAYLRQAAPGAGAARPLPAAPLPAPAPALPRAAPAATMVMAECCVCLDDVAMAQLHALFPCGHRCLCGSCAATLMAAAPAARCCPKCRAAVVGSAQIFDG